MTAATLDAWQPARSPRAGAGRRGGAFAGSRSGRAALVGARGGAVLRRWSRSSRRWSRPTIPIATSWSLCAKRRRCCTLVRHRRDRPRCADAASSGARAPRCWRAWFRCRSRWRWACRWACLGLSPAASSTALLMRMIDAMLAIPFLILAIALAAFLGPSLRMR